MKKLISLLVCAFLLACTPKASDTPPVGSRGYRAGNRDTTSSVGPGSRGIRQPSSPMSSQSSNFGSNIRIVPNNYRYAYPDCAATIIKQWKDAQISKAKAIPGAFVDMDRIDQVFTLENFPRQLAEIVDTYCTKAANDIGTKLMPNPAALDSLVRGYSVSQETDLILKAK